MLVNFFLCFSFSVQFCLLENDYLKEYCPNGSVTIQTKEEFDEKSKNISDIQLFLLNNHSSKYIFKITDYVNKNIEFAGNEESIINIEFDSKSKTNSPYYFSIHNITINSSFKNGQNIFLNNAKFEYLSFHSQQTQFDISLFVSNLTSDYESLLPFSLIDTMYFQQIRESSKPISDITIQTNVGPSYRNIFINDDDVSVFQNQLSLDIQYSKFNLSIYSTDDGIVEITSRNNQIQWGVNAISQRKIPSVNLFLDSSKFNATSSSIYNCVNIKSIGMNSYVSIYVEYFPGSIITEDFPFTINLFLNSLYLSNISIGYAPIYIFYDKAHETADSQTIDLYLNSLNFHGNSTFIHLNELSDHQFINQITNDSNNSKLYDISLCSEYLTVNIDENLTIDERVYVQTAIYLKKGLVTFNDLSYANNTLFYFTFDFVEARQIFFTTTNLNLSNNVITLYLDYQGPLFFNFEECKPYVSQYFPALYCGNCFLKTSSLQFTEETLGKMPGIEFCFLLVPQYSFNDTLLSLTLS